MSTPMSAADQEPYEMSAADREQYERWVDEQIGPRQVGGRYDHGYEDSTYQVLAIERGPRDTWPVWRIHVRDADGERWHCTGWDTRFDREVGHAPHDAPPAHP